MKNKGKFFRLLTTILICFTMMMSSTFASNPLLSHVNQNTTKEKLNLTGYKITDINDPEFIKLFPGTVFRQVVFDAVENGGKDGTAVDDDPNTHRPGCTSDMEDALYNFRGVIKHNGSGKPDNEKIKNIGGIDKLRNAKLIEIKYNAISDFEFSKIHENDWFGQLIAADQNIGLDEKNVVWDFSGNSLEKLPEDFGGRLIIKQPGGSSYTYDEDLSQNYTYSRSSDGSLANGSINILKSTLYSPITNTYNPVTIDNCSAYYKRAGATDIGLNITSFNNTTAQFTEPKKSGTAFLSVGTDDVIKYHTQDEYANITPGLQSFKYYLTQTFRVYDQITAETFTNGIVQLIKSDEDNPAKGLEGAVYGVYKKDDSQLVTTATTDVDGKLTVVGLWGGDYYFQEISAPDGYFLNKDQIDFTVSGTHYGQGKVPRVVIQGGETSIQTSEGKTVNAPTNRYGNQGRLFSGGKDLNGNKLSNDIVLTLENTTLVPNAVEVTYAKLEVNGKVETNVLRHFNSLQEAEDDINKEKSYDIVGANYTTYGTNILGPVSVVAFFNDGQQAPIAKSTTDKAVSKIDVAGEKVWVDYNNGLNLRPDSVTIQLLRNGIEYKSKEVTAKDNWKYTFYDVPEVDMNGVKYTYTVDEKNVATGYTADIKGTTITNTIDPEENNIVTIQGKKIWDDADNLYKTRPDKVLIELYQNGVKIKDKDVTASDNWSYNFNKLAKVDKDGKEYVYTVLESSIPNNYTSYVNGYDITNTLTEYPKTPEDNPTNPNNKVITSDEVLIWKYGIMMLLAVGVCMIIRKKDKII